MADFIKNYIASPNRGLYLDSIRYASNDDSGSKPTMAKQWEIELLKGSSNSFRENAMAIERVNREMARILGVEQLLLGTGSAGSFALSRDKTSTFFLMVESALTEIRDAVQVDLVETLFKLNGWPEAMTPQVHTDTVRFADVEQITAALRDLAQAGVLADPASEAIGEIYDMFGLTRADADKLEEIAEERMKPPQEPSSGGQSGSENREANRRRDQKE